MRRRTRAALVDRLEGFDAVVEVGIGTRTGLAAALADAGVTVTATDIRHRPVPDGVDLVRDDVTAPDLSVYEGAGAVYGLNLPAELQRPTLGVARRVGADCHFTTLGTEVPVVEATPTTLPGETLFRAESERA